MYATRKATEKIIVPVLASCIRSPLTSTVRRRSWGSGTSSRVTRAGPVKVLADHPLGGPPLIISYGDVVEDRVARNGLQGPIFGDVASSPPDDDRQLSLKVHLGSHPREDEGLSRAQESVPEPPEEDGDVRRLTSPFPGMLGIVAAHAQDLGGSRDGWEQPGRVGPPQNALLFKVPEICRVGHAGSYDPQGLARGVHPLLSAREETNHGWREDRPSVRGGAGGAPDLVEEMPRAGQVDDPWALQGSEPDLTPGRVGHQAHRVPLLSRHWQGLAPDGARSCVVIPGPPAGRGTVATGGVRLTGAEGIRILCE